MALNAGIVQPHSSAEPLLTSLNRLATSVLLQFFLTEGPSLYSRRYSTFQPMAF